MTRRAMSPVSEEELEKPRLARATISSIIGESDAIQEILRTIGRLTKSELNVLITGESGTGKELVARALFKNSLRRRKPFVAINVAAIPVDLLESELFGHEKGAFTGANKRRIGSFEQARGGTLFLDEIGSMPHELQSRLLRVLSEGKFFRVGGTNQISVNVRIIAATNQNLEARIEKNIFRSDLYHRLNAVRIKLPPVRERVDDIPTLVQHFLQQSARQLNIPGKLLSPDALKCMVQYNWPGNVREVENVCQLITVTNPAQTISVTDLPLEIRSHGELQKDLARAHDWKLPLRLVVHQLMHQGEEEFGNTLREEFEVVLAQSAYEYTGSKKDAARQLGWHRNTVARRLKSSIGKNLIDD